MTYIDRDYNGSHANLVYLELRGEETACVA